MVQGTILQSFLEIKLTINYIKIWGMGRTGLQVRVKMVAGIQYDIQKN